MAYDREKIYQKAVELIKKKELIFIDDVVMLLPISRQTFYTFFPVDSDKLDNIKKLIDENKIGIKVKLRRQMAEADTPTDRAMLYKLVGTDDERSRLNKTEVQHSGSVQGLSVVAPTEEQQELINRINERNANNATNTEES